MTFYFKQRVGQRGLGSSSGEAETEAQSLKMNSFIKPAFLTFSYSYLSYELTLINETKTREFFISFLSFIVES